VRLTTRAVVWTAIAALAGAGAASAASAFGVVPMHISSNSMSPTMRRGDWIAVRKLHGRERSVARSEIVLFRLPVGSTTLAVKRVVAIGGDRLRITKRSVVVNGRAVPISGTPALALQPGDTPRPVPRVERVPRGSVFVVGDDAAVSVDSRSFGPVPKSQIVGRVLVVVSPPPLFAPTVAVSGLAVVGVLAAAWRRRRRGPATTAAAGGAAPRAGRATR
jgi:signal peptidase I